MEIVQRPRQGPSDPLGDDGGQHCRVGVATKPARGFWPSHGSPCSRPMDILSATAEARVVWAAGFLHWGG